MKTLYFTSMIVVFLLFCTNGIQVQNTQTKLNQIELMKQFIGNWKYDIGKDTTGTGEGKSFGDGLELCFKGETKGKIVFEMKALMGYDKRNDKLIEAAIMNSSPDINLYAWWFTLKNTCIEIPYEYIFSPEKAPYKWEVEFTPDSFIQTMTKNKKVVQVLTFTRE